MSRSTACVMKPCGTSIRTVWTSPCWPSPTVWPRPGAPTLMICCVVPLMGRGTVCWNEPADPADWLVCARFAPMPRTTPAAAYTATAAAPALNAPAKSPRPNLIDAMVKRYLAQTKMPSAIMPIRAPRNFLPEFSWPETRSAMKLLNASNVPLIKVLRKSLNAFSANSAPVRFTLLSCSIDSFNRSTSSTCPFAKTGWR